VFEVDLDVVDGDRHIIHLAGWIIIVRLEIWLHQTIGLGSEIKGSRQRDRVASCAMPR